MHFLTTSSELRFLSSLFLKPNTLHSPVYLHRYRRPPSNRNKASLSRDSVPHTHLPTSSITPTPSKSTTDKRVFPQNPHLFNIPEDHLSFYLTPPNTQWYPRSCARSMLPFKHDNRPFTPSRRRFGIWHLTPLTTPISPLQ